MISRRHLLRSSALTPLALAGCASLKNGLTFDQVLAVAVSQISSMAGTLLNVIKQLAALGSISWLTPTMMTNANNAVAGIQSVAQSLLGVSTSAAAQPLVAKIETYMLAFLGAIPLALLTQPWSTLVSAAIIVVPTVFTLVELAAPTTLPAPTVQMTPAAASATLAQNATPGQ